MTDRDDNLPPLFIPLFDATSDGSFADPFDADDLALSAYLDGEATAAEMARIEGDAGLLARLRELQAVTDLLGDDVAPPAVAVRDGAIAAALAAFDEERVLDTSSTVGNGAGSGNVISLESARRGGRHWWQKSGPLLASVAAGLVVLVGLGAVVNSQRHSDRDSSLTAAIAESDSARNEATVEQAVKADVSATASMGGSATNAADDAQQALNSSTTAARAPTSAGLPLPDLGSFTDLATLRRRATDVAAPAGIPATTTTQLAPASSELVRPNTLTCPPDTTIATATLNGRGVLVTRTATGTTEIREALTCAPVAGP